MVLDSTMDSVSMERSSANIADTVLTGRSPPGSPDLSAELLSPVLPIPSDARKTFERIVAEWPAQREIKRELRAIVSICRERHLLESAKWASELLLSCREDEPRQMEEATPSNASAAEVPYYENVLGESISERERDLIEFAHSLFGLRQYRRAAHFLSSLQSNLGFFLYNYALFLAGETAKEDAKEGVDKENPELPAVLQSLKERRRAGKLDSFGHYLLGIVYGRLGRRDDSLSSLKASLRLFPGLWAAWQEVSVLATKENNSSGRGEVVAALSRGDLSTHWSSAFLDAYLCMELMESDEAAERYEEIEKHFPNCPLITCERALVQYHKRDYDTSQTLFEKALKPVSERSCFSLLPFPSRR